MNVVYSVYNVIYGLKFHYINTSSLRVRRDVDGVCRSEIIGVKQAFKRVRITPRHGRGRTHPSRIPISASVTSRRDKRCIEWYSEVSISLDRWQLLLMLHVI